MNILVHLIFILCVLLFAFLASRFLNWYLDLVVKAINEDKVVCCYTKKRRDKDE